MCARRGPRALACQATGFSSTIRAAGFLVDQSESSIRPLCAYGNLRIAATNPAGHLTPQNDQLMPEESSRSEPLDFV